MKKFLGFAVAAAMLAAPAVSFASVDLTLVGGAVVVPAGSTFVDPGYSAFSTIDGDITGQVSTSPVDTSVGGVFTRTYDVTDSALDSASASRQITVQSGGGGLVFCSSPLAPGFNVSLPGGGCGSAGWVAAGALLPDGSACSFTSGCILPKQ